MSKGKVPFAREATGLVREIGGFTALALVMSAVIGAGINSFAVQAYSYAPAGNVVSPLLIVLLVAIPFGASAICLAVMSSAMPRSGGPYVIMSRAVSPSVGFLASWGSWVSMAFSVGLLAWWDVYYWGLSFTIGGYTTANAGLIALGIAFTDMTISVIIAIIITLAIIALSAFGVNIWGRVVQALFIIPAIGSILTVIVFFGHAATDLPRYWNAVFGGIPGGTYWDILSTYGAPYTPTLIGSFAALPGIIFAYTAFYASAYVGGEVKNPKKNMLRSTAWGMAFIILLFTLYLLGIDRAVGGEFLYAYGMGGSSVTGVYSTLPLFAAVYTYFVPALSVFLALTAALWLLNDLPPFMLVCTRSTFAWSFDREFPEKFAEINERFHSPFWSVILVAPLALFGIWLSAYTPWGSLIYITFIDCFTYLFICVAALTFTKRYKSAYEKGAKPEVETSIRNLLAVGFLLSLLTLVFGVVVSMAFPIYALVGMLCAVVGGIMTVLIVALASMTEEKDQEKRVKVSALQVFGWVGTISWVLMLIAMWIYVYSYDAAYIAPLYGMTDAPFWEDVMVLLTFFVGAIIYFAYKWRNKRSGIDVQRIYAEIPPE